MCAGPPAPDTRSERAATASDSRHRPGPPPHDHALGNPTRHEIFRDLAAAGRDVDVAELTEHLGINHNAVRQHLAKLVAAGLVVAGHEQRRTRPGRPRRTYRTEVDTAPADAPYEHLAAWLTEAVATGATPVEVGRRVGAAQTRIAPGRGSPLEQLSGLMDRLGFAPEVRRRRGRTHVVLGRCPYVTAVLADQPTVCALHRGIAEGAAATLGGLAVDDLVARDPRAAGCLLGVREVPAGADER